MLEQADCAKHNQRRHGDGRDAKQKVSKSTGGPAWQQINHQRVPTGELFQNKRVTDFGKGRSRKRRVEHAAKSDIPAVANKRKHSGMSKLWFSGLGLAGLCCPAVEIALSQVQAPLPMQGGQPDGSVAIDRALKASTLTQDGMPFYSLMEHEELHNQVRTLFAIIPIFVPAATPTSVF